MQHRLRERREKNPTAAWDVGLNLKKLHCTWRFEPGNVYKSTPSQYWDHRSTTAPHNRLKKLQRDKIHQRWMYSFLQRHDIHVGCSIYVYEWQVHKCTLFFHEISLEFLVPTGIFRARSGRTADGRYYYSIRLSYIFWYVN